MSKFRYYVIHVDGDVTGTNDESVVADFACCEECVVIDSGFGLVLIAETNCVADLQIGCDIEDVKIVAARKESERQAFDAKLDSMHKHSCDEN